MVMHKESLHTLKSGMRKLPQTLINVRVTDGPNLIKNAGVCAAVTAEEKRLGATGRVLLRASGTEPVVRVMVEGQDETIVAEAAQRIAAAVRATGAVPAN
jgi:phosphoglucosamine mutase